LLVSSALWTPSLVMRAGSNLFMQGSAVWLTWLHVLWLIFAALMKGF
jgi:hypothetical protein